MSRRSQRGLVGGQRDRVRYRCSVIPPEGEGRPVVFEAGDSRPPDRDGDHPLRLQTHNRGRAINAERFGGRALVETRRIR